MVALVLLLACRGQDKVPEPLPAAQMEPTRLLSRVSLDLRGIRPSEQELERVEADPEALVALTEEYLADPLFEERMVQVYSERMLTRADYFTLTASAVGLSEADQPAFLEAVGEEGPRIAARVAAEGLPWTEVVTGDWTMSNELLAEIWPIDYPAGSTGWQVAHYTDGRPAAGLLASNGLWWRYTSTDSNANRKRANQASRILLCHDYLVRPIDFNRDVDLLDEAAVAAAVQNNPSCVACHNSLDPFSAYFFGFWAYIDQSAADVTRYHPEREQLWLDYLGVAPGFYGQPGDSLADLGQQMAADPRFPDCAVSSLWEAMLRRPAELGDQDTLTRHREAFLAGGLTIPALLSSIVRDPLYTAADSPAADETGAVPLKMMSPDQLGSAVEALTGFRWNYAGYNMLESDYVGLRTLAGGADGLSVVESARAPNATAALVQQRLAEAAALTAVQREQGQSAEERLLFTEIDWSETPETDREAMVAQIQRLHLLVFGARVAADGEAVAANLELWSALRSAGEEIPTAWAGLLSVLLRDPDFIYY